jgi:hypothetical protein
MAGPEALLVSADDAAYALGPDTIVIVVEGGDRPSGRGVRTTRDIALLGPFPNAVDERFSGERPPVLFAFARLAEGCLALGTVRVTTLVHLHGRLQEVGLYMETPLPYDLLDRVRPTGPPPAQPGLEWLGLVPADPLAALERFVAGWHAHVPPASRRPAPSGIVLPEPLRVFHRAAAGRAEVYGSSVRIYPAPETDSDWPAGMVAFGQEGDGVFTLLMDSAASDPMVYYAGLGDQILAEREPLSGFLLLFVLARAAMEGPFGGMAFVDREQARRIVAPLRPVPLRPLRWPGKQTHFFAGPGIMVQIADDNDDWLEVYVGARHRALLRPLRELGLDWEHFTG